MSTDKTFASEKPTSERTGSERKAATSQASRFKGGENGYDITRPLMANGAEAMQRWVVGGQELARFYTTRMKKDLSLMSEFASCRTPQDFTEVWLNAARSAARDYSEEFERMMSIGLPERGNGHGGSDRD